MASILRVMLGSEVSLDLSNSSEPYSKWEAEKLQHNLRIEAIPYNERLSSLLLKYIPTLSDLESIASTLAFVAFDTESVPNCYKTTDVGLAFMPDIYLTSSSRENRPTLKKFVDMNQVEVASFKIRGRYYDVEGQVRSQLAPRLGCKHRPLERLLYGEEKTVDVEELDAALVDRIELFRQRVPEKKLVLVGLSLQNDFERLCLEFPGMIRFFSGWIDLSAMIKAVSPTPPKVNTGLGVALTTFHYRYMDTGFGRRHQAAHDAIRTLAVLHGLMDPENVAALVLRQHEFEGINVQSKVYHLNSELYRALLHVDGGVLPEPIGSAQKLAFEFQAFNPSGVAADCSNAKEKQKKLYPSSVHTERQTLGCICFRSNRELKHFIGATNGLEYGRATLKVVRAPLPAHLQKQIMEEKLLKADRRNSRKKQAQDPEIDWTDSFHNIFSIEDELEDKTPVLEDSDSTSDDVIKDSKGGKRQSWLSKFFKRKILRKGTPRHKI